MSQRRPLGRVLLRLPAPESPFRPAHSFSGRNSYTSGHRALFPASTSEQTARTEPGRCRGEASWRTQGRRVPPSLESSSSSSPLPWPCSLWPSLQRVADHAQEAVASNAVDRTCNGNLSPLYLIEMPARLPILLLEEVLVRPRASSMTPVACGAT